MNKLFLPLLFLPLLSIGQSAEDDEITFRASIDWLDRKLNYIYYDVDAQKWWLNKFYVNEGKEVTIKNIFTDKPRSANIKEKVYLIRKFQIQDINPFRLEISDVHHNQGRIVKGKLLEMHTFGNKRIVHKTVDGRRGSDVSFVQISFPKFLTDSIADYADLVKAKLREAIIASTKVYPTGDFSTDRNRIMDIMVGEFKDEEGNELIIKKEMTNVLTVKGNDSSFSHFGYDPNKDQYYYSTVSSEGIVVNYYNLINNFKLLLQNIDNKGDVIEFETFHSFRFGGKTYYRK